MVLSPNLQDREQDKFLDDGDLGTVVKTLAKIYGSISGSFTPSGLNVAGEVTEVPVNANTWTKLPTTNQSGRNAIAVQNPSPTVKCKVNYGVAASIDTDIPGFTGMIIFPEGERFYDITDNIDVFAKCETGNVTLNIEELS